MTRFDERENAFEAKFAHDSELQFKAEARRNKIVAHWAAGLLGKTDDEISAYVGEVIRSDMKESGSEDVVRKLAADLTGSRHRGRNRTTIRDCNARGKTSNRSGNIAKYRLIHNNCEKFDIVFGP